MFFILSLKYFVVVVVVLQTSIADPVCVPSYGMDIDLADCAEAMKTLLAAVPLAGGWDRPQRFSRNANEVGKFHHMPLPFIWRTCAFEIDLTDPPHRFPVLAKVTTWQALSLVVAKLLRDCVLQHKVGGKLVLQDFEVVVINPLSGIGHDTCMASHKPLAMSLGRCIEARGRAREQIANNLDQTPLFHSQAGILDAAQQPPSPPLLRPTATRGGFNPPVPSMTASASDVRAFDP